MSLRDLAKKLVGTYETPSSKVPPSNPDSPLISLIKKYANDIDYSRAVESPGGGEGYQKFSRGFGEDLVKLPSFTYNRREMVAVGSQANNFNYWAQSNMLAYIMRRAAIEAVPVPQRELIWKLMESSYLQFEDGGQDRFRRAVEVYVRQYGKPQVERNLLTVQKGFESVGVELDALKKDDTFRIEQRWTVDVASPSHKSTLNWEMRKLEDILNVVRSL